MGKYCPICGAKIGALTKHKVKDGEVCVICSMISESWRTESVADLQRYWNKNNERFSNFSPSQKLKSLMSEVVTIDDEHQLFIIGKYDKMKNIRPTVYSFNEVDGYSFQKVGEKTITKKKGGIGRALVGGALAGPAGAIVGASTSKQETTTKGGTNLLKIEMNISSGKKVISMTNPPLGFTNFLDKCIEIEEECNMFDDIQKNLEQVQFDDIQQIQPTLSGADEIRKYKNLLDEGIITQEEFEAKKKQLLGL